MKAVLLSTGLISAFISGVAVAAPVPQAPLVAQDRESEVIASVDGLAPKLNGIARDIWAAAEVGFKEVKSSERLQKELRAAGFKVTPGVAGMPTAFIAEAGSGGPVIALFAEFDALPGLAQHAVPHIHPIDGQRAGHACGHNLLGAASVTAAIAIKKWQEKHGVKGTIRLYGAPAEEGGFSKVYMVRDGLLKDVDVTLDWHPGDSNSATPSQSLAMISGKFRFGGVASHASNAPERGRSALDGVEVMNVATNFLREHVPQDARIHYVITHGGESPNIVPEKAENFYFVRHHDVAVAKQVWERVVKAAEGAAIATGTKLDYEVISAAYSRLPNLTLAKLAHANLTRVGGYQYTPEEAEYAAAIIQTYPERKITESRPDVIEPIGPERKAYASSDMGDVTWVTPTMAFSAPTWVKGTPGHSWQSAATSGTTIGEKGALVAAKTIALSATQLLTDPALIEAAKAEFKQRTADFTYSSFIGDRKPPLDYTDR